MGRVSVLILVMTCFLLLVAGSLAMTHRERVVHQRVNDVRENHNRQRLRSGSWLQTTSHGRARYLRRNDLFRHPDLPAGVGENIAWITCRSGWARTVVRWWMNSPTHRPILLGRYWRRMGVGVSTGEFRGWPCVHVIVNRFK